MNTDYRTEELFENVVVLRAGEAPARRTTTKQRCPGSRVADRGMERGQREARDRSREPRGRVGEDVRRYGAEESDAGDLSEPAHQDVRCPVMVLEMSVG